MLDGCLTVHPDGILLHRVGQHTHAVRILVLLPFICKVAAEVIHRKRELAAKMMIGKHLTISANTPRICQSACFGTIG